MANQNTPKGSNGNRNNDYQNDKAPLKTFFTDSLKKMKWSEETIISGLRKMQQAATNQNLYDAFQQHEMETQTHISRLNRVFELLELEPRGEQCNVLEALINESDTIVNSTPEGSFTRDTALIISAQKVEHHEIASYGGLLALAQSLDLPQVAKLLQTTLNEEKETDKKLTEIAESSINIEAAQEAEE